MSGDHKPKVPKKLRPPLEGIAVVAMFWWWGSLLLYAPIYLGIMGEWRIPFNVLGGLAIAISLGGALVELGKLWKNQALAYWSVGLVFLIPALLLHLAVTLASFASPWDTAARIVALFLVAFGGPFLLMGFPYLFWKPPEQRAEQFSPQEARERKAAKRRADINTITSLIITLLSFATVIVRLILEFGK